MEKFQLYAINDPGIDAADKRRIAVEAALSLIAADCLGPMGGSSTYSTVLDQHMKNLASYATSIQKALEIP